MTPRSIFDRAFDALLDLVRVHSIAFCLGAITEMHPSQSILLYTLHDYCHKKQKNFRSICFAPTSIQVSDLEAIVVDFANNRGEKTSLSFCLGIWKSLVVSPSQTQYTFLTDKEATPILQLFTNFVYA